MIFGMAATELAESRAAVQTNSEKNSQYWENLKVHHDARRQNFKPSLSLKQINFYTATTTKANRGRLRDYQKLESPSQ